MPAGSEPPRLPHAFRPLGVRLVVYTVGPLLLAVVLLVWFALPQETRDAFTPAQRLTLAIFGAVGAAVGYALARCRVVARDDEVVVVNGYRTRRFHWNQILAVSLRPGSPWAVLDLADGTSVAAMGIQGSDGSRALAQARQLRQLVEVKTRTERDD